MYCRGGVLHCNYWRNSNGVYSIFPITTEIDIAINVVLNLVINIFGGLYLLDFLTLGWFKRFSWFTKIYRPVYVVMSFLTLAPLYRNIYYALLSRFNRWKIFTGLLFFITLTFCILAIQRNPNFPYNPFNSSEIYVDRVGTTIIDGYYRDKNPEKISSWVHISSATVEKDVLEVFVSHKIGLESAVFEAYENISGYKKETVITKDSLRLAALSNFYRFSLDGKDLDPVSFTLMDYTEFNQKGMLGFIPLDSISRGQHSLELYLNFKNKSKVAQLVFYMGND